MIYAPFWLSRLALMLCDVTGRGPDRTICAFLLLNVDCSGKDSPSAIISKARPQHYMTRNRGKRRSLSQKIGDKAEHQFGAWATDRGLSATLVWKDYGLDFVCQIFQKVPHSTSEEIHGAVLMAQVRGTEGASRPRIKLNREDAEKLLRQTGPAWGFARLSMFPGSAPYSQIRKRADISCISRLRGVNSKHG